PLLFRPPVLWSGASRGLNGATGWLARFVIPRALLRVNSEKVETDRKRRPGPVGLYFLIGIYQTPSNRTIGLSVVTMAFFQLVEYPALPPFTCARFFLPLT